MDIPLNPDPERLVKAQVESGRYPTAVEVIADAVRLLAERERRLEQLRKNIQSGVEQIERGESTEYDEHTLKELFEGIESEGRARLLATQECQPF